MIRVGIGYDVHTLSFDRQLVIGGVLIDFEKGLYGHSDADVLVHAIMDSILGALSLGDIGTHFPPSDDRFKDADSISLLKAVVKLSSEKGYKINNIDSVVVTEKPKLSPYIALMRENIANACGIPVDSVSVKATTEEGLLLKGEGIAAHCVCSLENI